MNAQKSPRRAARAAFPWDDLNTVLAVARGGSLSAAARALGVGNATIIRRHVLPNAMVAALTFLPFILNGSITTLTSLDFLGRLLSLSRATSCLDSRTIGHCFGR